MCIRDRANIDFPSVVENTLHGYSYIIYPTIKHTKEKPRYRLVVKPSDAMNAVSYTHLDVYKRQAHSLAE